MSKEDECEQTICLEGDASGAYRKFAQKRFKTLSKMYENDLSESTKATESPAK